MDMLPPKSDRDRAKEFVYGILTSNVDLREAACLVVDAAGCENALREYFRRVDQSGIIQGFHILQRTFC